MSNEHQTYIDGITEQRNLDNDDPHRRRKGDPNIYIKCEGNQYSVAYVPAGDPVPDNPTGFVPEAIQRWINWWVDYHETYYHFPLYDVECEDWGVMRYEDAGKHGAPCMTFVGSDLANPIYRRWQGETVRWKRVCSTADDLFEEVHAAEVAGETLRPSENLVYNTALRELIMDDEKPGDVVSIGVVTFCPVKNEFWLEVTMPHGRVAGYITHTHPGEYEDDFARATWLLFGNLPTVTYHRDLT